MNETRRRFRTLLSTMVFATLMSGLISAYAKIPLAAQKEYNIASSSLPGYAGFYKDIDGVYRVMLVPEKTFSGLRVQGYGKNARLNLSAVQKRQVSELLGLELNSGTITTQNGVKTNQIEDFIPIAAKYTYKQLVDWYIQILESRKVQYLSVNVNIELNRIEIGIPKNFDENITKSELTGIKIPPDAVAVVINDVKASGGGGGTTTNLYPCRGINDSCRPVRAGYMVRSGNDICTLGMFARDASNNIGMITALHCVGLYSWNTRPAEKASSVAGVQVAGDWMT
jgi:hypothetical protein